MLRGVALTKLYPNDDEPFRGIFVAEQVKDTSESVRWAIVAPVPWVPRVVARFFHKPYTRGQRLVDGVLVQWPRYPVLPRRILYATVPAAIAWSASRAFARACASVDAEFVHAHELLTGGAAARRLCSRAGLPYVVTVHGLDLYTNLDNPRWRAEILQAARSASAIICVSRRLAEDCIRELGIDPACVVVVPNTYDVRRFRFMERTRIGQIRAVSVGRLAHEKGHDVLLRALDTVLRAGVDMHLTLVGDGPQRAALESLVAELGMQDAVTFTGVLLDDAVADAMYSADLFVLPSRSEGFGVALIEAMATGLPVVATRSGGPDDIVSEEDGLLVDPDDANAFADALMRMAGSLDTFDNRSISKRTAEKYSPLVVAGLLVDVYESVTAAAKSSGTIGAKA